MPAVQAVQKSIAKHLAVKFCGAPPISLAEDDANQANLLTSEIDDNDKSLTFGETAAAARFQKNVLQV